MKQTTNEVGTGGCTELMVVVAPLVTRGSPSSSSLSRRFITSIASSARAMASPLEGVHAVRRDLRGMRVACVRGLKRRPTTSCLRAVFEVESCLLGSSRF